MSTLPGVPSNPSSRRVLDRVIEWGGVVRSTKRDEVTVRLPDDTTVVLVKPGVRKGNSPEALTQVYRACGGSAERFWNATPPSHPAPTPTEATVPEPTPTDLDLPPAPVTPLRPPPALSPHLTGVSIPPRPETAEPDPPVDDLPTTPRLPTVTTAQGTSARSGITDQVLQLLADHPHEDHDVEWVMTSLNVERNAENRNSVSGTLARLTNQGRIARVAKGRYRFRKFDFDPTPKAKAKAKAARAEKRAAKQAAAEAEAAADQAIVEHAPLDIEGTVAALLEMILLDVSKAGAEDATIRLSDLPLIDEWRTVTARLIARMADR